MGQPTLHPDCPWARLPSSNRAEVAEAPECDWEGTDIGKKAESGKEPSPRGERPPATGKICISWVKGRAKKGPEERRQVSLQVPPVWLILKFLYKINVCACVYVWCVCVCVCAQLLSCVQLFATHGLVAHQAPLSMGFSRQEYWSGLPFPPPGDLPRDPA